MNDFVLNVSRQFNEIGHITGDPYQETGVLLGMLLSIDEHVLVLAINLEVMSAKAVVKIDQVDHPAQPLSAVDIRKVHVVNRAEAPVQTQLGDRLDVREGPAHIPLIGRTDMV